VNILAIEASSEACSCALLLDGVVSERFQIAPRRHTALLLPMVRELLDENAVTLAQLDTVAYGQGPGSFTGVRIAACVAQGLALSADRGVIAVSSLAALAARFGAPGEQVLSALDARMGEVYLGTWCLDADGIPTPLAPEQLGVPSAVELPAAGDWVAVGSGWATQGVVMRQRMAARLVRVQEDVFPGAAQVALLAAADGVAQAPELALPGYLRRQVATPRSRPLLPESSSRNRS